MSVEIEIKKSRFIAYVVKAKDLHPTLDRLKLQHKRARHIVWAYRVREDGVLKEKAFDDGEPKGTAAKPLLSILRAKEIEGYALVVVRYFGGVKLGAAGLSRAYAKAGAQALNSFL